MSNDIAITSQPGATVGTAAAIFSPEGMDRLVRFATLMADSKATVPAHLAGKPADCLAVTMQAAQWGMNPFAVAQKTHVVNGTLGYEAQLVNAVVSSSNLLATRLNYKWDGDWSKVSGKTDKSPSLTVTVWATIKGESEPRTLTISMAQAGVRNSPSGSRIRVSNWLTCVLSAGHACTPLMFSLASTPLTNCRKQHRVLSATLRHRLAPLRG